MAKHLRILHSTEYHYNQPVSFGSHRLMLRPRDAHDLWVEDAYLTISPPSSLRWYFDAFGNSVAEATFEAPSDRLTVVSELVIRRYVSDGHLSPQMRRLAPYPFAYSADELIDLSPYIGLANPDDLTQLTDWLDRAFPVRADEAVGFLRGLSDAIHAAIRYSARDELGTHSAAETIHSGVGTCRDFAFLFMEAARIYGFAARFVTGYLYDGGDDGEHSVGGGATHAWADVFIPGEGWIEFDPTNRIVGGAELIRVATTRAPHQASPIMGSFVRDGGLFLGMDVSVEVSLYDPPH